MLAYATDKAIRIFSAYGLYVDGPAFIGPFMPDSLSSSTRPESR
jgi:hypothetical protein